jgi:hypothetical protein
VFCFCLAKKEVASLKAVEILLKKIIDVMIPDLTITLIQPDLVWEDKRSNLLKFEDFFHQMDRKTDLIVLTNAIFFIPAMSMSSFLRAIRN